MYISCQDTLSGCLHCVQGSWTTAHHRVQAAGRPQGRTHTQNSSGYSAPPWGPPPGRDSIGGGSTAMAAHPAPPAMPHAGLRARGTPGAVVPGQRRAPCPVPRPSRSGAPGRPRRACSGCCAACSPRCAPRCGPAPSWPRRGPWRCARRRRQRGAAGAPPAGPPPGSTVRRRPEGGREGRRRPGWARLGSPAPSL